MANPTKPESKAQRMDQLRASAHKLAAQPTRPTEDQILGYFALAQGLPNQEFDTSFATERAADTPVYREVVRARRLLIFETRIDLGLE